MPPSGRKGKTRARRALAAEPQNEPSDAETPEAIPTPTRASRKRGRATEAVPLARNTKRKLKDGRAGVEREDTEGTELQEQSEAETEPSSPTEQEIIQSLKVADKHVNATEDFANNLLEGRENVPGYGKIAGRDWIFIIRKIEVNIGRPESHERLAVEENGHISVPSSRSVVDIDLGPDRQVSRLHAVISYDPDTMQWFIIVNGRNGLRVDNNLYKRSAKTYLRNGSVIEIANTQMAFITTPADDNDGPVWDASIIRQAQKSSEDDDDGEDDPRNDTRQNGNSTSRGQLQNTSMYQSDYNGQQQQHHHHQQQQQQQKNEHPQQRTHPHSQRAKLQTTPGTPVRSSQVFANKSSPAANYARGVMMESTESIDYSADGAKDLKPPHSYAQLIGMAILSATDQQMTLNNIYQWIKTNYAFYRFTNGGWQNSIRHNLSLNKAFTKIARRTDEPGKGMKWMIEPTEFETFVQQGMKGCRRPNPIPGTQSTLDSPNSPLPGSRVTIKRDDETTPPTNSYHAAYTAALATFTPDRGPRRPVNNSSDGAVGLGIDSGGLHDTEFVIRTTPRNGLNAAAKAAGSPGALYVSEEGRVVDTPFPLRAIQRLAPASTLRQPSDFIQFSSPAPFWKMEGLYNSPYKPLGLSPLKTPFSLLKKSGSEANRERGSQGSKGEDAGDNESDGEPKPKGSPIINSSSPPRAESAVHRLDPPSPTVSRPASAVARTLSQLGSASTEHVTARDADIPSPVQQQTPPATTASASSQRTISGPSAVAPHVSAPTSFDTAPTAFTSFASASQPSYNNAYTTTPAAAVNAYSMADDGEDEGIDLVKGFQPIGAFHQRNHLTMSMGMAGGSAFGR